METPVRVLWTLLVGSQIFALSRLVQLGIIRRYRFFAAYLAISIARFICLVWFPVTSATYSIAWFISEPLMFVTTALVCWEAYSMLCSYFPGNQRFFARLSLIAGSIAAVVSAVLFRVEAQYDFSLRIMFWATRFIAVESAIFMGIVLLVVKPFSSVQQSGVTYPVRSWNNRVHVVCCTALFCMVAGSYMAANILGTNWGFVLNCIWLPAETALFVTWGVALVRLGEDVNVVSISAEEEEHYRQLEAERLKLLSALRPTEVLGTSRQTSEERASKR